MEDIVSGPVLRKLLLLDQLSERGSNTVSHQLLHHHSPHNYLVQGPKQCGKTSLLFEYAYQCAENGLNVLFITQKRKEALPHLVSPRAQPPSMPTLKLINILYVETARELVKTMATLHLRAQKYSLVVIDDLHQYFLPMRKDSYACASEVCAFTCDAVCYLRSCGLGTMLLCSVNTSTKCSLQGLLGVCERWLGCGVRFQPQQRNKGFVVRTKNNYSSVTVQGGEDDVKGVQAEFDHGVISLL